MSSIETECKPIKIETDSHIEQLILGVDTFLLDCDGVIWSGSRAIPGANEFHDYLKTKGKNVYFLTNNSTKSRMTYVKKLANFGIKTDLHCVVSASHLAANYIKNVICPTEEQYVYVIGMEGIKEELDLLGIKSTGYNETNNVSNITDLNTLEPDPNICAVLIGLDLKMNYDKFAKAHLHLATNPNLPYICTNDDVTLPSTKYAFPGAGALLALLNTSLKTRSPIIVGKPSKHAFDTLQKCYNLDPRRTCMIGDRLTTDIKFALNNGMQSVLVLSGATNESDLNTSNIIPKYYAKSIGSLIPSYGPVIN